MWEKPRSSIINWLIALFVTVCLGEKWLIAWTVPLFCLCFKKWLMMWSHCVSLVDQVTLSSWCFFFYSWIITVLLWLMCFVMPKDHKLIKAVLHAVNWFVGLCEVTSVMKLNSINKFSLLCSWFKICSMKLIHAYCIFLQGKYPATKDNNLNPNPH